LHLPLRSAAAAAMAMESSAQITQMTHFILNEAKDKAEEIGAKALQEFNLEKVKFENAMKEKICQEYERKMKQVDTQHAIARSTAINRSRLEKIKARQAVIGKISQDSTAELQAALRDGAKMADFLTKLIVQGSLMLLEDEVQVRCRACDDAVVKGCLDKAAAEYSRVVQVQSGKAKTLKLTLDGANKLAPAPGDAKHGASCLGGVVLACSGGNITVDNTIDSRLGLVMEQSKPMIRKLLFEN